MTWNINNKKFNEMKNLKKNHSLLYWEKFNIFYFKLFTQWQFVFNFNFDIIMSFFLFHM